MLFMKPVIGITPSPIAEELPHGTFYRYALSTNYSEAVEAAGGIPIILPPQQGNVDEMLDMIDGLLLSGGGDIRPDRYGDDYVHETTYGIHDLRDELALQLARGAVERDLPVLCICRGIQILNVALEGTLIQDVADEYAKQILHLQHNKGIVTSETSHELRAARDSLL